MSLEQRYFELVRIAEGRTAAGLPPLEPPPPTAEEIAAALLAKEQDERWMKRLVERQQRLPELLKVQESSLASGRLYPRPNHSSASSSPAPATVCGESFSIINYNLLACSYTTERRFDFHSNPHLLWVHRHLQQQKELEAMDADIFTLQEVELLRFDREFRKKLERQDKEETERREKEEEKRQEARQKAEREAAKSAAKKAAKAAKAQNAAAAGGLSPMTGGSSDSAANSRKPSPSLSPALSPAPPSDVSATPSPSSSSSSFSSSAAASSSSTSSSLFSSETGSKSKRSSVFDWSSIPDVDDFGSFFRSRGYEIICQNDKGRGVNHTVGGAILYKKEKFEAVWEEHRSRTMVVALRVKSTTESASSSEISSDASSTAASCSSFSSSSSSCSSPACGSLLYVCSVHLEGHPSLGHTRVAQIKSLVASLVSRFSKAHPASVSPFLIISGDFNSNCHSGVHKYLTSGRLSAGTKDEVYGTDLVNGTQDLVHPFKFRHVHEEPEVDALATYLFPEVAASDVIDFIFYSESNLKVEKVMQGVSHKEYEEAMSTGGIPNLKFSSDHFPTGCVFRFLKPNESP